MRTHTCVKGDLYEVTVLENSTVLWVGSRREVPSLARARKAVMKGEKREQRLDSISTAERPRREATC